MKVLFKLLISFIVPFFLLFCIEVGLRVFNYGVNLDDLFLITENDQYFYMNKDISKRYFISSQATTGNIEFFKKTKDKNTIRLFVLGESAALGFPYPNNISFQKMIKYELQKYNPNKDIEVINLSLTAINSYTFYDFGKELVKYAPDAILIYGGHNEYYGALGAASTNSIGNSIVLNRLFISLRKTKLVQLIGNITNRSHNYTKEENDNLMKYVVKNQLIVYKDNIFEDGISQFKNNLEDLLSLYSKENIPVFLSTVATNLKDQYPFKSTMSDSTDSANYYNKLRLAQSLYKENQTGEALAILNNLYEEDNSNADCCYTLGEIQLKLGNKEDSYHFFNEAKQKDCLRFRAPDEINEFIHDIAKMTTNVHLVDSERAFRLHSEDSIPGYKLLLEHVHPTIEGHRLIAKCFIEEMYRSSFFTSNEMENYHISEESLSDFPVLQFDSLVGVYACKKLKEGFPFYEKTKNPYELSTTIQKLSMQYVTEKNWYHSMENLYNYAVSSKDYPLALNISRVRVLDNPYDHKFYTIAGNICSVMKNYPNAFMYYTKSFNLYKTFPVAKEIISVSLRMDKPELALPYLDYVIAINQNGMNFKELKDLCIQIINYKKQLQNSSSITKYQELEKIYRNMGNNEVADLYKQKQT